MEKGLWIKELRKKNRELKWENLQLKEENKTLKEMIDYLYSSHNGFRIKSEKKRSE
ncbi:MAG: hypothetical protein MRK02_17045 [Candidatus Scalindua sp.]|nr:hypothetical protein [Candidatus Scalindua sp.]